MGAVEPGTDGGSPQTCLVMGFARLEVVDGGERPLVPEPPQAFLLEAVADLEVLFDPARSSPAHAGRR